MFLPNYPEFTTLKHKDKKKYNKAIKKYPPISDILFETLLIWWNFENSLKLSSINGNILINYSQPFDLDGEGLCLIGGKKIDKSIQYIFGNSGLKIPRLIHEPEFVINKIKNKKLYVITEEPDYFEYVIDPKEFITLAGAKYDNVRRAINHFNDFAKDKKVEIKNYDLSNKTNSQLFLHLFNKWMNDGNNKNDPENTEFHAIRKSLVLNQENITLIVDNEICGIVLYQTVKDHIIGRHVKVTTNMPFAFKYLIYSLCIHAVQERIKYVNCEMDLGIEGIRSAKQELNPIFVYKKYTIERRDISVLG